MNVTIEPGELKGSLRAIASKSDAHRLLIASAFADAPTEIYCGAVSEDIEATVRCLRKLGSGILYEKETGIFRVMPVPDPGAAGDCTLDVGESGSTLRFLLPIVTALGISARFVLRGRLPERPLSPLWEELTRHGAVLDRLPDGSIRTKERINGGEFRILAGVSSQFVSGLLLMLPLLKEQAYIRLTGKEESRGYIRMTIHALERFGIRVLKEGDILKAVPSDGQGESLEYRSPSYLEAEADWSNGAFWETAGMLTGGRVRVFGLDEGSLQEDRAVRSLKYEIARGNAEIDARDIPDLVPVLSVLAAVSPGVTRFTHAERLRLKESDRIRSTVSMLLSLGGDAKETEDGLVVRGKQKLAGGTVDSFRDHRIAMSAAIASIVSEGPVKVLHAESVRKSYPGFWDDFRKLGGKVTEEPSGGSE